jgi:hypothetical protein
MSFQETQARFRRLFEEQIAWKLLHADNAPLVLAFVTELFRESSEVPFGQARSMLDIELERSREQGLLDAQTNAAAYLRQWIQAGWLRELDDSLSKTDACEVALRFCRALDQRDSHSTASHLRIVQDAVRDLAVALNPSAEQRLSFLESRKAVLQTEIDDLHAGVVHELSGAEQRERIREVYQLASVLNSDFRRIEDEIRTLDRDLRVQMIESNTHRGEVLTHLLGQEDLLAKSDAGRAFDGFFKLLMDQNRSTELREQLRSIMTSPAIKHLSSEQQRFLHRLMPELTQESDRVFRVRRRTQESLRAFVESGVLDESRAVERLLIALGQRAMRLREAGVSLRTPTAFTLPSGSARVLSVDRLRLKTPDEHIDTSQVIIEENAHTPNMAMLEQLHAIKVIEVASRMRDELKRHGPLSVAGLLRTTPITAGLEELVAHLRIARAVGATEINDQERVLVADRTGQTVTATIPHLLVHADLFPRNLDELGL